nr:hypothetical protein [Tanacetum cinerariifolium]
MGDTIVQTIFENVSKLSNDSLLTRARVDSSKDDQCLGEDAFKQGRKIYDIDVNKDITLVNDQNDAEMFNVNYLHSKEVFVEKELANKEVSATGEVNDACITTTVSATTIITTDKITLAQVLVKINTSKPKAKRIVLQEPKKRRKFFAAKREEEKRNKPPTQDRQRKIMCTYLKNVEGKKLKDLKNKSFNSIQNMFDRAFNRQKVDDDKEIAELKELIEIIPDKEEVAIDSITLVVKEDLKDLYNLVKDKYGSTRPVEDLDLLLWGDLKTMFEPHIKDQIVPGFLKKLICKVLELLVPLLELNRFGIILGELEEGRTGLPECADDTVTDYSRPSPTVESTSGDDQNKNFSASENGESTDSILSKPAVKFVKAAERSTSNKVEAVKKPSVRYAELYRKPSKQSIVRGNQQNWNNLKSQQLGENFNNNHKNMPPRPSVHRPYRSPMRPVRPNMNAARPKRTSFYKPAHSYNKRPFQDTTQELMIILIQRVQRLERELKARTPIHEVDRGRSRPIMAWVPKKVASSGWPFVFEVPGLMTHLVASLILDNTRSCVMQGESFTQGKASSIPIVFIVVGEGSSIIKLSFVIIVATAKYQFYSFKLADEANSAFRTFEIQRLASHKLFVATFSCYTSSTLSGVPIGISGGGVVDLNGDEDPTDEEGDNDMGNLIGGSVSLGGGSNGGDGGNTRDEGKMVGRAIGACGSRIAVNGSLLNDIGCGGGDKEVKGSKQGGDKKRLVDVNPSVPSIETSAPSHESPIVQSVEINTKLTSYIGVAGVSAKDQPKVNSNFRPMVADPVFDGVNISIPRKVVKKKRIMMNKKGLFFLKFDTEVGLEAVLEGGPWMIRKSPIILKKWSMDTRFFKEELTRILIWVKLHDVPIQFLEKDGVVLLGVICKTSNGFQTVDKKKKRKGKLNTTNDGQLAGPSVKQSVRYEPNATTSAPMKGATNVGNASKLSSMLKTADTSSKNDNITTSNSFFALNEKEDDDEEVVEDVGAIPSNTAVDAKIAIQWHNGTSRSRSNEPSDGLAAIQAQLNNLGREIKKVNEKIKKVNEKVYAAQVGCEHCKGPHYSKDFILKEEWKNLEEAYNTQFGGPFQGEGYIAASSGFYQRNNVNPSQMSKVLQKRGFGSLPSSTKANPRDQVKSISTTIKADSCLIRHIGSAKYVVSTRHNRTLMYETRQMTIPFPSRLNGYYYEEKKGSYRPQFSKAYTKASQSIPQIEKYLWIFTLPCFINNVCFDNALADLGDSASVMPLLTYLNLELKELAHTKLTIELADKTVKYPKGIAKNVLVRIGDDLMPMIEEGEVIGEFITRDDELDDRIDDYPSYCDNNKKIHIDYAQNLKFSCMIVFEFTYANFFLLLYVTVMSIKFHNSIMKDKMMYKRNNIVRALMNVPIFVGTFSVVTNFTVLENMDNYRDERMGDITFGKPFLRDVGIKTRRSKGMVTIYNGNDDVTNQMVRLHSKFKYHTNEQCNEISPLLKVSKEDKMNGISHPYKKLKGFYQGVLNLGPDYI